MIHAYEHPARSRGESSEIIFESIPFLNFYYIFTAGDIEEFHGSRKEVGNKAFRHMLTKIYNSTGLCMV
jgi:hypothetical protein